MKKITAFLLCMLLLLSLAACGASEKSEAAADYSAAAPEQFDSGLKYYRTEAYEAPGKGTGTSEDPISAESGQKLIRKLRISAETDDYQAFADRLTGKIAALGGYIEEIEASTSGLSPSATIVVRVPADRLNELTESVAGIGNITYKHESQQDVTLQYVDTESHISALRTEQDRLLELLDKAENLSEVLEIEDRLAYVRYELESYERSLRALANQVDYATATIDVTQVKAFTPTEEIGFWEKIGSGFRESLDDLWDFLKEVFSELVIGLPYLLVFLVLPLIIVILIVKRHRRKKKAARKTAEQKDPAAPDQPPA